MEGHSQVFDICIVCAMYEEAKAVLNEFSARCNVSFESAFSQMSRYTYRYTTIQNKRKELLSVLVTWPADRGPVQTGLDLSLILQEFRPRFAAMTGICAGDRKKVKLGDLIIAEAAYLYEEGKVISGPDGQKIHLIETETAASTSQVIQYAKGFDGWKEPLRTMKRARFKRELKPNEEPRRFIVPMASGMAVRGDNPFPWFKEQFHRNTIALDMEAATFYRTFGTASYIHALVVKGVSDYGDGSKNDAYHEYAARASAVYLLSFIQEYVNSHTMPRRDVPPSLSKDEPSPVWNIPYPRNPFFTGRENVLTQLADAFKTGQATALSQVISGLGGIGKTQIAVEFAYQHRNEYQFVLWTLADTHESLVSGYVAIARLLNLPEKDQRDQSITVEAVLRWLTTHTGWLLILDNADDLALVYELLPPDLGGHLLLTTRAQATGTRAHRIEVDIMPQEVGALFLLRRAKLLALNILPEDANATDVAIAREITNELGGLPLALDQAGAYIEEAQCSLADYQSLYHTQRAKMLKERGNFVGYYPESVTTTWSLSFTKIKRQSPAAADLLRFSAFLAPDAIPEELLIQGAAFLGPVLEPVVTDPHLLNHVVKVLLGYSLIYRDLRRKTFSIHRLVQAVLKDKMSKQERKLWSERTVQAVQKAFPLVSYTSLIQCERFLSHALSCADLIERENMTFIRAGRLLHQVGVYLVVQARYKEAETLSQHAVKIYEQHFAPNHINLAMILTNLAVIYCFRGKADKELEPIVERALEICEQHLTLTVQVLDIFCNCAWIRHRQGRDIEAEVLLRRALKIGEQRREADLAAILYNLAEYHYDRMEYVKAKEFLQRSLKMHEQEYNQMHPKTPAILTSLARIYSEQGKDSEAQRLYQDSIKATEQQFGPNHPNLVRTLSGLAQLYKDQGIYLEAEKHLLRALAICIEHLESNHSDTLVILKNLAFYYCFQGKHAEAEEIVSNTLKAYENQFGLNHFKTASILNILGELYRQRGEFLEAEGVMKRALVICEKQLGLTNAITVENMSSLGWLYYEQNKASEAMLLLQRALEISRQKLNETLDDTKMLQVFAQTDMYIKILSRDSPTD